MRRARSVMAVLTAAGLGLLPLTGEEAFAQGPGPGAAPATAGAAPGPSGAPSAPVSPVTPGAPSAPANPAALGAPVALARSAEFEVTGPGGAFVVQVSWPAAPPPPGGYGAIYLMDAGWSFGTLRDALALPGLGAGPGIGPTIVVALGWPEPDRIDLARRGPDLIGGTGPDKTGQGAAGPDKTGPGEAGTGSAAATLALLTDQVIPRVEGALPVDPARRMIAGHSFGGAFALRAGRARPDLFSHVGAGSPSIWTDPEGLLAPVPGALPHPQTQTLPQTLITLGALEDPAAARAAGVPPERVERLAARDMAGRARRYAAQTGAEFAEIAGQDHGGALAPFLMRLPAFLWR